MYILIFISLKNSMVLMFGWQMKYVFLICKIGENILPWIKSCVQLQWIFEINAEILMN